MWFTVAFNLSSWRAEGHKAQSKNHSISLFSPFSFFKMHFKLICHRRQLSRDIKLSSWHYMYPVKRLCHLQSAVAEGFARQYVSKMLVNAWHFWITHGNQATTPVVKEPKSRGERGNRPIVTVKPLVLIGPQHPVLCGELNLGSTCLLKSDGAFYPGVVEVFVFSLNLCVWVYIVLACCPHFVVWFGLYYVTGRGSVQTQCIATNCPAGDRGTICGRRVLNT